MSRKRRALVVEDEPSMRLLLERVLSRAGWEVVAVDGVQEAHPWLDSVDAMIVDYFLGRERGSSLVSLARDELGIFAPPAILMTATPDAVKQEEQELFSARLTKPFRVAMLVEKLEALVGDRPRARSGVEMKAVEDETASEATKAVG
ncbi:MAG: response regulator [Myxococcota bacterium]